MKTIEECAENIKDYLLNLPEIKEYIALKEAYENDPKLNELKKLIVRAKNENRMDDYLKLKKEFDDNPLVNNYLNSKEEVAGILKEISDILN